MAKTTITIRRGRSREDLTTILVNGQPVFQECLERHTTDFNTVKDLVTAIARAIGAEVLDEQAGAQGDLQTVLALTA